MIQTLRALIALAACIMLAACLSSTSDGDSARPGHWSEAPAALPDSRTEVAATVHDGRLILAGGVMQGGGEAEAVWQYDPGQDDWEHLTDLPEPAHHIGLAALDDRLYVVGGYPGGATPPDQFQETNALWVFDLAAATWHEGPPMPTARGALTVAVLDGRIHAIGGTVQGNSFAVATHEAFDPETDTWTSLASMTHHRDHLGAAVIDGQIYVAGGRTSGRSDLRVLEVYDPETNSWTTMAPMPTGRSGIGVAALDAQLYVLGGETFGTASMTTYRTVERYDPASDSWTRMASMPTARHGLGAVALDGGIHAVSGGPGVGFSYSNVHERFTPD